MEHTKPWACTSVVRSCKFKQCGTWLKSKQGIKRLCKSFLCRCLIMKLKINLGNALENLYI